MEVQPASGLFCTGGTLKLQHKKETVLAYEMFKWLGLASAGLVVVSGCGGGTGAGTPSAGAPLQVATGAVLSALPLPLPTCVGLTGRMIPAGSIGLPTRGALVETAREVSASGADPAYCEVMGSIQSVDLSAQPIRFQLNLPQGWNGKAVHFGGGGYNGLVASGTGATDSTPADAPTPLQRRYVTFGSDSGHTGTPFDGYFGVNDEMVANYGGAALKKVKDVAHILVGDYYGRAPVRQYFAGNSKGGHEGFAVVQRWPQDYDGVVAIHPAYNYTRTKLQALRMGRALYATSGFLSTAKLQAIHRGVLGACDAIDGVQDGLVSNPAACNFDAATLRCPDGTDAGDACLSDAQVHSARAIATSMKTTFQFVGGLDIAFGFPILAGAAHDFAESPLLGLGASPVLTNPAAPVVHGFSFQSTDQWLKFFVTRDPLYEPLRFDETTAGGWQQRFIELSQVSDASSVEIEPFVARGGKLLVMHGTTDQIVPIDSTKEYWDRLVARHGRGHVAKFARFYVVPGYGHTTGAFKPGYDWLAALDSWVEQGVEPPRTPVVVDKNADTAGRTRPMCEYPSWPRYNGTGDVNQASSFTCSR